MKKVWSIFCIALILAMTGCGNIRGESKNNIVDEKFMLYSMQWGEVWENVKENPLLSSAKVIKDDGNIFAVEIEDTEFLGINGKTVLMFSVSENSFPLLGLQKAYFLYDNSNEGKLIAKGKEIYGERKTFYLDKNGIENPLNLPSWFSEKTLEDSLTEKEMEHYLEILDGVEKTRIDAIMRGPLVVISVDLDKDMVVFHGDDAAKVKNLRDADK